MLTYTSSLNGCLNRIVCMQSGGPHWVAHNIDMQQVMVTSFQMFTVYTETITE